VMIPTGPRLRILAGLRATASGIQEYG